MAADDIRLQRDVQDFVNNLPLLLLGKGYKINADFADKFVDEIVDFIYRIPSLPSYHVKPEFAHHFERYGRNLQYVFWKRGNTTWYIFFNRMNNRIIVRHISNNWLEGQYIR